jgi:DNA primase
MSIPPRDIKRVKEGIDIVEVISEYVTLEQRKNGYLGCCPFHNDKTPSFKVDSNRGSWYCFGCQQGGDVITFIMQAEDLNFPDAVRFLAKRTDVHILSSKQQSFQHKVANTESKTKDESASDFQSLERDVVDRFIERHL